MRSSRPRIRASRWPRRILRSAAALLFAAGLAVACAPSFHQRHAVHVLTANSEVNPVMRQYIDRGIDEAERTDAAAVVIRLDTPGGLSDTMEKIVQRIQSAKVPVIVYVAPSGAKAASAGTFITMSAHVAAMAPGTSIGAAHPVSATGGDIGGTLGTKVENNAAAYARSIADKTGRNADWAESAVRQSVSASTNDAVRLHVVDYSANSVDDLLRKADGRTVTVDGRSVTLANLESAPRVNNNMTLVERFLLVLSDPNVAFMLLAIGGLGLLIEFLHPGVIAPGVFGAIALILAFFALGTLPVNWAGVALVLLAFVLFAAEMYVSGFGALGVAGVISLVAGGLLLTSTGNPDFQVSRWLVAAMGAGFAVFFFTVVTAIIRMRRLPAHTGTQSMIGATAVARGDLDPRGFVFLHGERWRAVALDGPIASGARVEVTGVKGFTLTVRRSV
ncbi:MAG: nodulation protein NfeD [Dehalococcoidia bacterium]|nr:MAG: nodulation protein NfeD [Dehalococcoidia bacterium]